MDKEREIEENLQETTDKGPRPADPRHLDAFVSRTPENSQTEAEGAIREVDGAKENPRNR